MPSIAQIPYAAVARSAASSTQSSRRSAPPRPSASAVRRGRSPRALVSTASMLIFPSTPSSLRRSSVGRVGRLLAGLAEVVLEHLERGGGGGGTAVAAVLDHRADDDRRLVVRPVAAPPRLRLVRPVRVAGELDDLLCTARLARDVDGEVAEDAGGRSDRRVRRLLEPPLHPAERDWVEARRLRRLRAEAPPDDRGLTARAGELHVVGDVRGHELAAVRDQRVEARHLQRRDEDLPLADRHLDRVAGLPRAVDLAELLAAVLLSAPLGRRDQARHLGADVDAGPLAEPEPVRPALQRVAAVG